MTKHQLSYGLLLLGSTSLVFGCVDPLSADSDSDPGSSSSGDPGTTSGSPTTTGQGPTSSGDDTGDTTTSDEDSGSSTGETGTSCGDGVVDDDEDCDDAGESAACNADCTTAECGDGVLNESADEECDDAGRSESCNADCTNNTCGDGIVNETAGEDCDDEGESETCNPDCSAAECGDGYLNESAGEVCEDGNTDDGDGCSASCQVESAGLIFLTSANGTAGFYGYDIEADSWATLTSPPATTYSQLTNDGINVFMLGSDNTIYSYDIDGDSWTAGITGPGTANNPIGFFQWFPDGFYYLLDGNTTMSVYRDAAWSTFDLDVSGSCAGTYDAENDELYIRQYQQAGFRVIDTTNDAVVRSIDNATSVGENSRTGTYYGGNFYSRTITGPILRLDSETGDMTDTVVTPISGHTGTDVDFATGLIYFSGYGGDPTTFQVFDTSTDAMTSLADQPSLANHSTITVMRPSL